jgi:hypothetical protein
MILGGIPITHRNCLKPIAIQCSDASVTAESACGLDMRCGTVRRNAIGGTASDQVSQLYPTLKFDYLCLRRHPRKLFILNGLLVARAGVQPATFALGVRCSMQLSYRATYTTSVAQGTLIHFFVGLCHW